VRATIRPGLQRATVDALGDRLGGIAVLRPRDGAVLALAGLGATGPQPPGSTFKIVTLAAALQHKKASVSSSYPVRTFATLSGVKLRNASDESCGGSLTNSFAHSCNSVFAPLGAAVGRKRMIAAAERFGFNVKPRVPGAATSQFPRDLKDDLAVGAAAIGQERDLATPLAMAAVGATIANRGVHPSPRIVRSDKVLRKRAVPRRVATQVRDMMLAVVAGGTGTAAALPGVEVAGKTGTAELRPTASGPQDPKNTDAWFVAFAPARSPRVAVAVMLVGAGQGGATAAPIARQVLSAAL
jgi:cell division protein FtsI/penicillin-binding protein 2